MRDNRFEWNVGPDWGMFGHSILGIGLDMWGPSKSERERWASLTDDEREVEIAEHKKIENIRWTKRLFQAIHDSLFYGQADEEIAAWPRQARRKMMKMSEKDRLSYWLKHRKGYNA